MNKRRRNRLKEPATVNFAKCGWRVSEWADAVGLCRASVYNLLSAKAIASVKSGSARIITTSPPDYLASLEKRGA
jgi:hypothetical protein